MRSESNKSRPSCCVPGPFGESDKIVSFLTENHGNFTGIAKGAFRSRKRFVNSLEPFSLVNLSFQDRAHDNLSFLLAADLIQGPGALMAEPGAHRPRCLFGRDHGWSDWRTGGKSSGLRAFTRMDFVTWSRNGASLRFLTELRAQAVAFDGLSPALDNCKKCRRRCA